MNEDARQEHRTSHTKLRKQHSLASSVNSELNCLYDSDECSDDEENEEERIRRGRSPCFSPSVAPCSCIFCGILEIENHKNLFVTT